MIISSEAEMLDYGAELAHFLRPEGAAEGAKGPEPGDAAGLAGLRPATVVELVGDVGAGKTTITRGLAQALGVAEPVTSPSFTIAKRYVFPGGVLAHYDFYRLGDPGLMTEDLAESIGERQTITVIEWGQSVADLLPAGHLRVEIKLREDGSREVRAENV